MDLPPSPSPKRRGESRADKIDLLTQRLNISRDHQLLACVGVEVAVGAAMGTEGDVKVEGERMRRHEA
jgi:hypothetical protein